MSSDLTIKKDIKQKISSAIPTILRYTTETIVKDGKEVMKPYYIYDEKVTTEVLNMMQNSLEYSYVHGKRISIHQRYKDDDKCIVILFVEDRT